MHAYYLSTMVGLLRDRKVSEDQLLQGTGLTSIHALQGFGITATQIDRICTNAIALSAEPQFGLRLGSHLNISAQGIFGYALMTSPTVRDALKLLVRYSRAIMPSVAIDVVQREGWVDVLVTATHLPLDLERFYCEVLYAAIIHNGSLLIADQTVMTRLELDYAPPCDAGQYHQVFGPAIAFQAGRCALSFDAASAKIAITTANPIAQDIFRRECDRLASLDRRRGGVSERVQQVLLQAGSEFPTCAAVAQQLYMSESTLQRRLAQEGCRYQQLLDQVRFRLANEYLVETTLPVAEIACLLGFSDTTNFRRSFKRWANATPSAVRRQSFSGRST
ncbi:putative HTH-type transcriptional regulator [Halioglobus japonicus]|nr:putative HTH-type transcriptional regulator [Halioglobus japonicus]